MLKYVAAIVLVFGLSVYVSTQYKQHAENPASYPQQPANKALPAPTNKKLQTNVSQPEWNPPRWYRLFGWPEGVGVWYFFTLVAIAEQTNESEIGRRPPGKRDAFVEAERAWMFVETGNISDDFEPDPTKVEILEILPVITNRGRTAGRITWGVPCTNLICQCEGISPGNPTTAGI